MTAVSAVFLFVTYCAGASGEPIVLAERGKPAACSIVLPDRPGPVAQYAAEELRDWTEKLTGTRLPIVTNVAPERAVYVGGTEEADLGEDGFRLKSEGGSVRIIGSSARGVLYGVYELLETYGGIGWFSSWHTVVPKCGRLAVPADLDVRQVPAFEIRDAFFHDALYHSEFGARIRMNENLRSPKGAKYGATAFRCGKGLMAHTFGTLVPAARYFDSHPDYFSEVDGHRLRSRTQLCTTNPDVERVFATNFMAAVRQDPDARYFAVCHDDWQNWCQCPACRTIHEAEGAPAGTELRFANRMAEILERELPGRMVKFAAYDYTQRPPKSTRARHNVLVEFAPVHCDCSMPLTESPYEGNVRAAEDLRGWGRLAGDLRVWDYYADFSDYQVPFPNVLSIRENLRFYRDNSVRQMFAQGNHNSAYADFSALKTWLLGKLMWNPDQPLEPLLRRFFDGFYGPAAPLARQYFDELHALPRDHVKNPLKITQTFNTPVLTDAFLDRALKLWNAAEAAVRDDPVHLRNVRLGKISVAYVILRRQGAIVSATRTPYPAAPARDLAAWMVGALDEFGAQMQVCEGKSIAEFHGHCRKLADPGRVTPPRDSVTVDAESVCRLHANYKVSVADDPAAGGGKAVRYPNLFPRVWSVQMPMENLGYDRGGRYRFLLRARIDRKPGSPDGEVIEAGISGAAVSRIRADELSKDYRWFVVAECEPKPGMTLYIAPGNYDTKKSAGNPAYDWLWVDQIEFVRVDGTADRCPIPVPELMNRASAGPSLVMTREQASAAKRRVAENADAKAWWTKLRADCEKELGRAVELPPRGGQWTHWYSCRKCATALKAKSPTEHVCPNCGELHTGWPYDDVAMGERHEGNATAIHDLGIAYLLTDDRRFARKATEWLLAYAERYLKYPMHNTTGDYGPDNPGKGKGGRILSQVLDECVWMIRVMQGYDCVAQTMTPEERNAVLAKLIRPSVDVMLSECAQVHNHECWHLTAFGMAGFLLGDGRLVDRAVNGPYNLYRQLQDGVYADGTWFEGAWGYHFYTIRALTPFVQALVNLGVPPPRRLREMFQAPFGQVTSSWQLPAVHDTARMDFTPGTLAEFYEHAYSWWGDDVLGWWVSARPRRTESFALHGRDGNPAVALPWKSDPFPAAGLAVLRSRSGKEGKDVPPGNYIALDYGKHGGWHGHYDKLNLILYGNGEILGEDPGCIGYGNPRHFGWYRTTLAHNSLSVDGRHQEEAEGSLIAFTNLANGAAVAVDAGRIAPGVRAGRSTALSGNLVFDLVWAESESEHDWEWAFHSRGKFSMNDRGKSFELPKPEQPMRNGRPTDSDGTDAWRWVRDLASRSQDGAWSARWTTDRTELNLFQRSASGVLTSGEGSAQPANRSFRLVANRVRGTMALFATVMTLDGEKSVTIGEPVAGDGGKMSFAATVGGKTYRLSVDRKARQVSFADADACSGRGPQGLTCEYRENPVGIDAARPRLSWKLPAGMKAQGAYEIEADGWRSGRVASSRQLNVEWGGPALETGRRVNWRVRVWDADGAASAWSETASFVCGVMRPGDWTAKWVAAHPDTRGDYDFGGAQWIRTPGGEYRTEFDLDEAPSTAALALLATDRYDVRINGSQAAPVSGHVHDPRFLRRADVAAWLHAGRNAIEVRVGPDGGPSPADTALLLSLKLPSGRRIVTDGPSWRAKALGGPRDVPWGKGLVLYHETESPAFRKRFAVAKDVRRATLYVTGVGFYEAALNGRRIGRKVLDPSPTDYTDRVLYSTYVLDGEVRKGENALDVLVGHGWFDNRAVATWNWNMAPWRDVPRFIAQLALEYADGTRETVTSDASWEIVESPVLYDDIREGEVVAPGRGGRPLGLNGVVVSGPKGRLVAEAHAATEVTELVKPKAVHRLGDGSYMVEFPVNFTGWVRLAVRGQPKGNVLVLRYDERVGAGFAPARPTWRQGKEEKPAAGVVLRRIDEHFRDTASHHVVAEGAAFQTDRVVCPGSDGVYEPRFTYNGFQYVWIRGWKGELRAEDVTGCFVHTAFRPAGSFRCSDPALNRLVEMTGRSYRSNFTVGVPTDCPHREKNGWTGDAQLACELAQYFHENTAGYEKWIRDLVDAQDVNGDLPGIVPTSGWGFKWGNGPGWDAALTVVPWTLYCYRGDSRALEDAYPAIVRYLAFTAAKATDGLVRHGLGDWCAVDRGRMPTLEYTSSLYYYQAQVIASRIAAVIGRPRDVAAYLDGARRTRDALVAKYRRGGGAWDNGGQTAQAMALGFGIVPDDAVKQTEDALVSSVLRTGGHVDFGIFGAKTVFRALSRAGRSDLALRMIVRPDGPSFGNWIERGATSLWEHWDGASSLNHIMFGDFTAWAMQFIGGIRLSPSADWSDMIPSPSAPAFREILLAPVPADGLDFAEAEVETPYGRVFSRWERTGSGVRYRVSIPGGTSARFVAPGVAETSIGPGEHEFTSK